MKKKNNRGFTLFELLVVISIIGILAAVGLASYSSTQKRARDAKRKEDLKTLQTALEQYYASMGSYPDPCYENGALSDSDGTVYLESFPADPKEGTNYATAGTCGVSGYIYKAEMETTGSGNAYSDCTQTAIEGEEANGYFCVRSLQ